MVIQDEGMQDTVYACRVAFHAQGNPGAPRHIAILPKQDSAYPEKAGHVMIPTLFRLPLFDSEKQHSLRHRSVRLTLPKAKGFHVNIYWSEGYCDLQRPSD
jgi:hypothetical protein